MQWNLKSFVALFFVLLFCCITDGAPLDPAKPPGGNFDLSHWKLTLPLDKQGGTNSNAAEASAAQLGAGYTNADFFRTAPDGAMVFASPALGAIAGGYKGRNSHPRTELRELLNPKDSKVNWTGDGVHSLTARCRVNAIADGGKVCIGQIHGRSTDIPLVMIYYDNTVAPGKVTAKVKYHVDDSKVDNDNEKHFAFAPVALNADINYRIFVTNGVVAVTVNGETQSQDFYATDPHWKNVDYYFKAGAYYTSNGGTTNATQVSFFALAAIHPAISSAKAP